MCVRTIFFKAQALTAREEEITAQTQLKKSLQHKLELCEKGVAIMMEKVECFELNNYRNVSTKELDVTKKAEKVTQDGKRYVLQTRANCQA